MTFHLWSEAEALSEPVDDVCNISVTLDDGRRYALNVWTFSFFETARSDGEGGASAGLSAAYMLPPDLFVADLSRATLEAVIGDLLDHGALPDHCLVTDDA